MLGIHDDGRLDQMEAKARIKASKRAIARIDELAAEDWVLDDPAGQGIEAVRPIRDEIRRRVEALVAELTA